MELNHFGIKLVGLLAMTALLAGCTSSSEDKNDEMQAYPRGCSSYSGYSTETGEPCSDMQRQIADLQEKVDSLQDQVRDLRELNGISGNETVQAETGQSQAPAPEEERSVPPPDECGEEYPDKPPCS